MVLLSMLNRGEQRLKRRKWRRHLLLLLHHEFEFGIEFLVCLWVHLYFHSFRNGLMKPRVVSGPFKAFIGSYTAFWGSSAWSFVCTERGIRELRVCHFVRLWFWLVWSFLLLPYPLLFSHPLFHHFFVWVFTCLVTLLVEVFPRLVVSGNPIFSPPERGDFRSLLYA